MERQKVYVIGYAAKGPGPEGIETMRFWNSLVAGKSGITLLEPQPEFANCKVNFGGQLYSFDISAMPIKDQKRNHPVTILSTALAHEALSMAEVLGDDGRISVASEEEREEIGNVVGSATSGIAYIAEIQDIIKERGEDKVGALDNLQVLPERPEIYLCKRFGIEGINYLPVSACATGGVSIGNAYQYLSTGEQMLMLAGGVERPYSTIVQAHFSKSLFTNMSALARLMLDQNAGARSTSPFTDPTKVSRSFALNRYGFVLSEGGGIFVLANEEYVIKNNTPVFAEVAGYAITNDADDDVMSNGVGARKGMNRALRKAGLQPVEVEYLNAHATSTGGDLQELKAIREVFGDYVTRLIINAPKSMTGHLTGAAGAVEAWQCVMSILKGIIPPTINHEEGTIDPEIDFTSNKARRKNVGIAMSNSFGFGGGNAVLIFREAKLPVWN